MKHFRIYVAVFLTLIVSFIFSLALWFFHFPGIRCTFIFESASENKKFTEYRYLPLSPHNGKIQNYIDELLLGPLSERCKPIFKAGTRVLTCIDAEKTLYVDFSDDIIKENATTADFKKEFNLFKQNINNNFPAFEKINIFVAGNEIEY